MMSSSLPLTFIKFLPFQNPKHLGRENKNLPFIQISSFLFFLIDQFLFLFSILIVQFCRSKLSQFSIIVRIVVVSRTASGIVTWFFLLKQPTKQNLLTVTRIHLPHYQPKPLSPNKRTKASWHNHFSSNRKKW